jgi:homoserine kinase
MNHVRVTVPATSANLGPGFDSLGLALALHNVLDVAAGGQSLSLEIAGESADSFPRDASNLVIRAMHAVFTRQGQSLPGLRLAAHNRIPTGAGLGSSAAALVAGAVAANALLGDPLSPGDLVQLCADLEGHPDNVAAALLGGLTVSGIGEAGPLARRVSIPPMQVAIVLPALSLSTAEQRAALPAVIPLADAAISIGRAGLVVQALASGDLDLLGHIIGDRLHVPVRSRSIPGYHAALEAGLQAGAAAITISGAGPALIAFAAEEHQRVAEAMAAAFEEATPRPARWWVLPVDFDGARVE